MDKKDFTEIEQKQIEKGLSYAIISDKEAAKKILALVPEAWMKKIPFFVRRHATTKTIEFMAKEYPELFAVAKREGEIPEKEKEELRKIINDIYEDRMKKHNIK
ncbi:MAG: hypothetical protein HXL76_00800 [[Eubacterium] sulci]|nr:hypothetical protein [[Eubacterium] sulci]